MAVCLSPRGIYFRAIAWKATSKLEFHNFMCNVGSLTLKKHQKKKEKGNIGYFCHGKQ